MGEILQCLGLESIGVPGSTAALALLNDAVKKGGAFASSSVGGLSGAFIPVSEDLNISQAVKKGYLSLEKLEAMTAVCSVGLDMIAIPGKVDPDTLPLFWPMRWPSEWSIIRRPGFDRFRSRGKSGGEGCIRRPFWRGLYYSSEKHQPFFGFRSIRREYPAPITSLSN